MKRISAKLVGSQIEPFTIQVNPGGTAGEILSQLNLEGYVLPIPPSPTQRKPLLQRRTCMTK